MSIIESCFYCGKNPCVCDEPAANKVGTCSVGTEFHRGLHPRRGWPNACSDWREFAEPAAEPRPALIEEDGTKVCPACLMPILRSSGDVAGRAARIAEKASQRIFSAWLNKVAPFNPKAIAAIIVEEQILASKYLGSKRDAIVPKRRPQLVYEARKMILNRLKKYMADPDQDWDNVPRWERHSISAVIDLEAAESLVVQLREQLREFGRHTSLCLNFTPIGPGNDCDCGWTKVWDALSASTGGVK